MNFIEHIVEPRRLILCWKAVVRSPHRNLAVGEVCERGAGLWSLRYLYNTEDFNLALESEFEGYPAFRINRETHETNVYESLVKRLPPRTRNDFTKYLIKHRISPQDQEISNFALLGYTEGRLPGDGFSFLHPFDDYDGPCELRTEVTGFRHYLSSAEHLSVGDTVEFVSDSSNKWDSNAIAILWKRLTIGYVNHSRLYTFNRWLKHANLYAVVDELNGTRESPRAILFVRVKVR